MNSKNVFSAAVVLLLLMIVAGGSVTTSVLGGVGLLLMGASGFPVVDPLPVQDRPAVAIVRRVEAPRALEVYELANGAGVVVFRVVDGRMTSRFFRSVARVL